MPSRQDLDVWAGNTFRRPLVLQDGGTPFDLTGIKLVFRAVYSTGSIRKDTDDGTGFSITDAAGGEALLVLSVNETRALPAGKIKYEIEAWDSDGQTTWLYGELNVTVWVNDDVDP